MNITKPLRSKLMPTLRAQTVLNPSKQDNIPSYGVEQRGWRKSLLIIAVSLVIIDVLHYSTAPSISHLHSVYRYFYFLPIVYAALRFGLWGGLLATIAASLVFIPHIVIRWQGHPIDTLNDLLVVVVLFGVALITGRVADRMREAQEKQAAFAEDLANSYHALESQGAELRRAERLISLGTLAGGLAHQIRNPVGIIRASSQLLDKTLSDENGEIAGIIQDEADRIELLVSRLLNYAGEQTIQRDLTDVGGLLTSVQRRVKIAADPAGIEVLTHCDKSVTTWPLDLEQMEQALVNLCINAIQSLELAYNYHRSGVIPGEISIGARIIDEADHYLQIIVSDNGPGVPQAIQSQIFDPFFTTKDTGTGLGLSVVQRIIEDHGGAIFVESLLPLTVNEHRQKQRQGTIFTISLPHMRSVESTISTSSVHSAT